MFVGMMVTASGQFLLGLNDFIYIRFVTEHLANSLYTFHCNLQADVAYLYWYDGHCTWQ